MRDRSRPDSEALTRLRAALAAVQAGASRTIPASELADLATRLGGGLTIDFAAAASLGQPMVILRLLPATQGPDRFADLSAREREVAALVAEGLRNREIARRLGIREATVKDHVHRILEKTGLAGRTAVAVAWRR